MKKLKNTFHNENSNRSLQFSFEITQNQLR